MTTLTLVDPQPMETLPERGMIFYEVSLKSLIGRKPSFGERIVMSCDARNLTGYIQRYHKLHAWSRTATFGEGA